MNKSIWIAASATPPRNDGGTVVIARPQAVAIQRIKKDFCHRERSVVTQRIKKASAKGMLNKGGWIAASRHALACPELAEGLAAKGLPA